MIEESYHKSDRLKEDDHDNRSEEKEMVSTMNERLQREVERSMEANPGTRIFGPFADNIFAVRCTDEQFEKIHEPGKITFLGSHVIRGENCVLTECANRTILEDAFRKYS